MNASQILQAAIERSFKIQDEHQKAIQKNLNKVFNQLAKPLTQIRLESVRKIMGEQQEEDA